MKLEGLNGIGDGRAGGGGSTAVINAKDLWKMP